MKVKGIHLDFLQFSYFNPFWNFCGCVADFSQHSDGHRANAAGNRRNRPCNFLHVLKIHIAAQLALSVPVDADVDHNGALLHHIGGDEARLADGPPR